MEIRSRNFRFGIFIILTSLTIIVLVVILTSRQLLQQKDMYYISYKNVSVSGLEIGSPVKYLGVTVGSVQDIYIDPEEVNRIIVKIALDKNTPIKEDARADLSTVGITGMKVIEIRGGSESAEILKPGRYIPAGTSITEELTDTADMLTEKLQKLLDNLNTFTQPDNLNKFIRLVENTTNMLENVNQLIVENRRNLSSTFETTSRISLRLDSLTAELDSSVRKRELVREIELVVTQARDILQRVDRDVTRGSALFHENMQKLQITLDNLNEASGAVRQDPSVLIWGKEAEEIPDKNLEQ